MALEIISKHGKVFNKQIKKDSINLFDDIFDYCNNTNYELKISANECIEKLSHLIAEFLNESIDQNKEIFEYIINKIKKTLQSKSSNILVNTCISLIGIFSNSIINFFGHESLIKYLEELIILFDDEIILGLGKDISQEKQNMDSDRYKPSKSIKYVLAIQKQYISLIDSYSNIIGNLQNLNEMFINVKFYFY